MFSWRRAVAGSTDFRVTATTGVLAERRRVTDVRCQGRSGGAERKLPRNGPPPGAPSAMFDEAGLSIWSVRLSPAQHGDQGFAARARSTGRPVRAHGGLLLGRVIPRRPIRYLVPHSHSGPQGSRSDIGKLHVRRHTSARCATEVVRICEGSLAIPAVPVSSCERVVRQRRRRQENKAMKPSKPERACALRAIGSLKAGFAAYGQCSPDND